MHLHRAAVVVVSLMALLLSACGFHLRGDVGIAGNWLWWNFVFGGMLTVVFFARLWRRAGVTTDVEFVELRYSDKSAAFLRGFRAIYVGVFMNCIIMGWVNLAMASILEGMFGIPHGEVLMYVALALTLTAGYAALSGLWGMAVTDAFQFVLAMAGCIVLAAVVLALPEVGGIPGLQEKLPSWAFRFMPALGEGEATGEGAPTITREMVAPFTTAEGASVLLPDWSKINPVLFDMFGQ